jgi:glutathione synthase/RimK-type ligase-like ATP-grasp enzyme
MLPLDVDGLYAEACRLDALGETALARQRYLDVLACDLAHAGALGRLGTLLFGAGFTSAARTVFSHAVTAHPNDATAHVRLAHLFREAGETQRARESYQAALALEPACPEAHQGMSYLLDGIDERAAARHRDLGFAQRALTATPYRGSGEPIRVLRLVSARGGNIPTRHILDDRIFGTHTLVVEYAGEQPVLPRHDVIFNTIGDADRCVDALAFASRILAGAQVKILNPPERVIPTGRAANLQRLAGLPGVIAPASVELPREQFAIGAPTGFGFPLLVRSPGFHTGEHFRRVDEARLLPSILQDLPGERIMALQYLDAAGPGGLYRKYRVLFIGGAILPLHLAISANWKVHYFTAGMKENAEHRQEEERFLVDMEGVLGPLAMSALAAIQEALGLDYGGVDFAVAPDGRLLLFEANATMTVVPAPEGEMWDYRRAAIGRVLDAARLLVVGGASPLRSPNKPPLEN